MKQLTNPVTDYRIALLGDTPDRVFGWIELLNAGKSAGFIYFSSESQVEKPHLGGNNTYIVMHQPVSMLSNLLSILRVERSLQIRFFDPEAAGVDPTAFLETPGTPIGQGEDPRIL